ncbi:MAG: hypothetical protein LUH10_11390 [Tannerellaceae bacterium]|nr:hypothetical protein [Tannerellaceae bacterium]
MGVKYGIYKTPVPAGREDKQEVHARFIPTARTGMERLCELVSARTAYSGSEVKGILDAFVYVFKLDLEAGFIIELEGLGTFYPAIVSKMEADEKGEKN